MRILSLCLQLKGEYGMRINDLVADAVMEYKLVSYRVRMSATKALLNLDADAFIIENEQVDIEDGAEDEPRDPRIGGCSFVCGWNIY